MYGSFLRCVLQARPWPLQALIALNARDTRHTVSTMQPLAQASNTTQAMSIRSLEGPAWTSIERRRCACGQYSAQVLWDHALERNCYDFEDSGEQRRNIYTHILPPYIWHHKYTTSSFHHVNMHAPLSLCLFMACSAALSERHPEIRWVKCSQHVPTGTGELNLTGVDLGALPSTLRCG